MTAAGYQVLVKLIKPYTRIGIEFIGAQVNKERNQRDAGQARSGGGHLFGPAPASLAQHNTPEGRHNVVTTLFQLTAARLVNGWLDRAASSWHHLICSFAAWCRAQLNIPADDVEPLCVALILDGVLKVRPTQRECGTKETTTPVNLIACHLFGSASH